MAKPEWGIKRICLSCGARFYDLNNSPIVCPSCGTVYDVEVATRVRKARPTRAPIEDDEELKPAAKAPAEDEDEAEALDEVADEVPFEDDSDDDVGEVATETEDEEEDDALIEDVEELDDGDDMSDVIEGGIDEDEEPR